jgi:hypothetical protein
MHFTIQAFWLQKAGNSPSDYEDAFWPRKPLDLNSFPIRVAIGDGATEASFSAIWARLLVWGYRSGRLTRDSRKRYLGRLQSRWWNHVTGKVMPWYAEQKMRDGAFSSLLGLTFERDSCVKNSEGYWESLSIGDSCLFQVRANQLIVCFPLDRTELFDNRPVLVSSVQSRNDGLADAWMVKRGQWTAGDVFYLMTDALACWFLRRRELRGDPLAFLDKVQFQADFVRLVEEQRATATDDGARMLKNDDVTLVRCSIKHLV